MKNMQVKQIVILFLTCWMAQINAQTANDVLRYSRLEAFGTARAAGVGGALGALGADFSMLSVNPAGLASYRKSEFTLSPGINIVNSKSTVVDGVEGPTSANTVKFGFRNVGFVFNRQPRNAKWVTYNIGIGFNQIANFNGEFEYEGRTQGSIADRWLELAYVNGQALGPDELDDFEAGPAFEAGVLFQDNFGDYFNDFEDGPTVLKRQRVTTKGSSNELLFSLAANYDNKLSIGATVGVPIINFSYKKIYEEEDDGAGKDGDIPFFNELKYTEDLNTSGVGIQLKLGVNYRVSQAFRIGLAFHTPTRTALTDAFYNKVTYNFTGNNGLAEEYESESPDGNFDYGLKTPLKIIGSAAYIVGRRGFISADIEYLDYSNANYNFTRNSSNPDDEAYQREVNDEIATKFGNAVNIRVGGEVVLNAWRLRAGVGLIGDPFTAESRFDNHYSAGFGYRGDSFYFDLAYRLFSSEQGYIPYNLVDDTLEPVATVENLNNQVLTTIGFRF